MTEPTYPEIAALSQRSEYHQDRLQKAARIVWLVDGDLDPSPEKIAAEVARLKVVLELGPGALPTRLDQLRWAALSIVNAIRIEASASRVQEAGRS